MAGGSRQEQQGGSWGKALQPLGKTGFLPFRGCSISHSRMNSQANWEAGNQVGAWGKRCGLPQQLCKPTPPETTTLRKFRKSPSGSWMAASYPAYGIAGIEKPNQAQLYAWGLSKGHQSSWDVSTQQSQAAKAPSGRPHTAIRMDSSHRFSHLRTAHASSRAAHTLCAMQPACSLPSLPKHNRQ